MDVVGAYARGMRGAVAIVALAAIASACAVPRAERLENPPQRQRPPPKPPVGRPPLTPTSAPWAPWTLEVETIEVAAQRRDAAANADAVGAAMVLGDDPEASAAAALVEAVRRSYARLDAPVRIAIVMALAKHRRGDVPDALQAVLHTCLREQNADGSWPRETLIQMGAAVNALPQQQRTSRTRAVLLEILYRVPQLVMQTRRALVAEGRGLADELREVLRGTHRGVETLLEDHQLDKHCPPGATANACLPVGARDFYAALVLGDLHDRDSTPDLLAALARPAAPAYYTATDRSPNTQHNAIFDALRRLADPYAAPPVAAIWKDPEQPSETRVLALGAYAFLASDASGVKAIGALASRADPELALAALTAVGRLADDASAIAIVRRVLKRHRAAYLAATKRATGPARTAMDAADAALAAARKGVADTKRGTDDAAVTRAAQTYAAAMAKRDAAHGTWWKHELARRAAFVLVKEAVLSAARIDLAIRCTAPDVGEAACFAATLDTAADPLAAGTAVAAHLVDAGYVKAADVRDWDPLDLIDLGTARIERAMIELGKRGPNAVDQLPALLAAAAAENRNVHAAVLWAIPLVATKSCADCVTQLDRAIQSLTGRTPATELLVETELLRNYFRLAGTP
jgi:hypothetical protein